MPMWNQLYRLLNETLFMLSQAETSDPRDAEQLGRDLQHLHELVEELSKDTRFFGIESRPPFGHLVSLMLGIFGDVKRSAIIRLKAASVLRLLMRKEATDSLALVLPGYFVRLQAIALSSANAAVAGEICYSAVEMIQQLLCLTLSSPAVSVTASLGNVHMNGDASNCSTLIVKRDENWLKMAGTNIEPQIFLLVSRLCANSNGQIRASTLRLLRELASECNSAFSTKLTVDALVDVCVTMRDDADESIAADVRSLIVDLRNGRDSATVSRHLVDKFLKMLKNFAKTVRHSANGFAVFQNLLNCVEALGADAFNRLVITSTSFADSFLVEILASIRVDMTRLLVASIDEPTSSLARQAAFLGFYGEIPLCDGLRCAQIWQLAQTFASSTRLIDRLLNDLLDKFGTFGVEDRIAGVILLTALTAASGTTNNVGVVNEDVSLMTASLRSVAAFALDMTSELACLLRDDVNDREIESFRSNTVHSTNTVFLSTLLYAAGGGVVWSAALSADSAMVDELRINTIYELLKWLPFSNPLIRRSALCAMEQMARDDTVGAFLRWHAAAIVFKASLESRDPALANSTVPMVLAELLQRADPRSSCSTQAGGDTDELFDATRRIVDGLLNALDRSDQKRTMLLLRSIRCYVQAVSRWYSDLRPTASTTSAGLLAGERLPVDIDDRQDSDDEARHMVTALKNEKANVSVAFPPIRSVVGVLNRTKHMISTRHLPIQRLVLDILDQALIFVRHFEDELLPMIHQNWQGLVRKFDGHLLASSSSVGDEYRIVAVDAIRVVRTMCRLSKGFVYQKVTNELMPLVCGFMDSAVATFDHCSKSTLNFYHQTAVYRLQLAVIECFPAIIDDCDISAEQSTPFVDVLRKYAVLSPKFTSQGVEALRSAATTSIDRILSRLQCVRK